MSVKHIWKDPSALAPGEAAASVRAGAYWLAVVVGLLLLWAGLFSVVPVDPESGLALVQAYIRIQLGAVGVGVAKYIVGCALALGMAQWFENTSFGQRIGNRGLILAALLILAGLIFGPGR